MSKDKKTFADRAKDIIKNEPDPALQKDLLEGLKDEQEAYREANGMNQPQEQAQTQPGLQQFWGGGEFGLQSGFNEGLGVGLSNQFNNDPMTNMFSNNYNPTYSPFGNSGGFGGFGGGNNGLNDYSTGVGLSDNFNNGTFTQMNQNNYGGQSSSAGSGNWFQNSPGAQNAAGFGMQMIPSVVSGLTNYFGSKSMKDDANSYAEKVRNDYVTLDTPERAKANLVHSDLIDLSSERQEARSIASDARRTSQQQIKRASRNRGEYLAGAGVSSSKIQKNLSSILGQSRQNQATANTGIKNNERMTNAQILNNNEQYNLGREFATDQFNAQSQQGARNRGYDWTQQANAYEQGQYGAITGMMGDATKIMANNQMISSLGDRYGYQRNSWMTPNQYEINYQGRNQ